MAVTALLLRASAPMSRFSSSPPCLRHPQRVTWVVGTRHEGKAALNQGGRGQRKDPPTVCWERLWVRRSTCGCFVLDLSRPLIPRICCGRGMIQGVISTTVHRFRSQQFGGRLDERGKSCVVYDVKPYVDRTVVFWAVRVTYLSLK